MSEDDLRDCFAMMATVGLTFKHGGFDPAEPWRIADAVLSERKRKEDTKEVVEDGIVAIKPKRRSKSE